jgi:hypothetical protein
MPSCEKYFLELSKCLEASLCTKERLPSECVAALQHLKVANQAMARGVAVEQEPSYTPYECALSHQSYVECKISLMNPRKRLRSPYGWNDTD